MVWSAGAFLPDSGEVQLVTNTTASSPSKIIVDFILGLLPLHYTELGKVGHLD
jgi:hypothetical protein